MNIPTLSKRFTFTATALALLASLAGLSTTAYALVPVTDPGVQSAVNNMSSTLNTAVAPPLITIQNEIPAAYEGIAQLMRYAYFYPDNLFPTYSANSSLLNSLQNTQTVSNQLTQSTIDDQLKSFAFKINKSYKNFNALTGSSNEGLPPSRTDTTTKNNLIQTLTVNNPSWDTLRLPWSPTLQGNLYSDISSASDFKKELQKNAASLNFDSFLDEIAQQPSQSDDGTTQTPSYIDYVMQTYSPLLPDSDTPSVSGSSPSSANESLFAKINDKVDDLRASGDQKAAYKFINETILGNPDFQKFWLTLRTLEAKRSLLLSNFNFLKAERTVKKGLGSAYNLKDNKGDAINDASPMQVEQHQLNKTVYNPDWYKAIKTASPATIARQQLLLTSMLLREEHKNQLLNERLLATQTLQASSSLDVNKQLLQMQESKVKQSIFNDTPSQPSVPAPSNTAQYQQYQQTVQPKK